MIIMYTLSIFVVTVVILNFRAAKERPNVLDLESYSLERDDRELKRRLSKRKRLFDNKRLNYLDSEIRRLEWRRIRAKYVLNKESELIDKYRKEHERLENDIAAAIKNAKTSEKKEA
nr:MAG TPA: hypothetical protein [Caudoviricetes sp.]